MGEIILADILMIKGVKDIDETYNAQLINYLRTLRLKLGVILKNFLHPKIGNKKVSNEF